ncbi:ATP-binding protein [Streptacidiphilus sp. 4-A2]|nr:ATP-binding protein [Streptacidiphilus sp. 4-A2]
MLSDPGKHYELRIVAEPQRFAAVRKIIQAHLRHWELPDLVAAAQLGVTELLGNVHRHVGPGQPCRLWMEAYQGGLRLGVHDPSPVLPQLHQPDPEDLSGRGLALVAALSKEWGAERDGEGKVVWFALQAVVGFDPVGAGPGPEPVAASLRTTATAPAPARCR